MSIETRRWRVGDTAPVMNFLCEYRDDTNTLVAKDLTGLTVKFKMVNAASLETIIAETEVGLTVNAGTGGTGFYDFATGGATITTPGIYWCLVRVYESSEPWTFPVKLGEWQLMIDSDTVMAECAHRIAVDALSS